MSALCTTPPASGLCWPPLPALPWPITDDLLLLCAVVGLAEGGEQLEEAEGRGALVTQDRNAAVQATPPGQHVGLATQLEKVRRTCSWMHREYAALFGHGQMPASTPLSALQAPAYCRHHRCPPALATLPPLLQNQAAAAHPRLVATAQVGSHLELVLAGPRLVTLDALLSERPYGAGEEGEATGAAEAAGTGAAAAAGAQAMDVDGASGISGAGLYGWEELLARVQVGTCQGQGGGAAPADHFMARCLGCLQCHISTLGGKASEEGGCPGYR